jgi:hypothetical protein
MKGKNSLQRRNFKTIKISKRKTRPREFVLGRGT